MSNDSQLTEVPFKSCGGTGDYVYITYPSEDSQMVYPSLIWFKEHEFEIFYNEGLEKPRSAIEELEGYIQNSNMFIPLLTKNVLESNLACKEIFIAALHNIPIISIYLEETELNDVLEFAIGKRSSIRKYELSDEEFWDSFSHKKNHVQNERDENDSKRVMVNELFRGRELESMEIPKSKQTNISTRGLSAIFGNIRRAIKSPFSGRRPSEEKIPESTDYKVPRTRDASKNNGTYYLGNSPRENYLYLSYSHENIDMVFEDMAMFNNMGVNVKHDLDIEAGEDYRRAISSMIANARVLIFYLSKESSESLYARHELSYAFENNVPIVLVFLEDEVDVKDPEMNFILKNHHGILRYDFDREHYETVITKHIQWSLMEHELTKR